jgi:GTP cyclohydrolase I
MISNTAPEKYDPSETAVKTLLIGLGENPERDGLRDTPRRVVKALREMTAGYQQSPEEILSRTFDQSEEGAPYALYNGLIVLRDIEFSSLCEHHLLPFVGRAHVAYIPGEDKRIVGISKIARLVDCFARRLQVQERLTAQIAEAIQTHLGARGVLCAISAEHYCMRLRGCKKQQTAMLTLEARGDLETDFETRAEALKHIYAAGNSLKP